MRNILEYHDKCTGCGLCSFACSKKVIHMDYDSNGFLKPFIRDDKMCNSCKVCINACPLSNIESNREFKPLAYAAYNLDEYERKMSSSGGIGFLLAKEIYKRNGIVLGAGFDESGLLKHMETKNEQEYLNIIGSKYIQSMPQDLYKIIKSASLVLVFGTPCQIAGVNSFLKYYRMDASNIYTCDLVCHGVNSKKIYDIYMQYLESKYSSKIKKISFRNKDDGWTNYKLKIHLENGNVYSKSIEEDLFMKNYLSNISLRDSCYNCLFSKIPRVADISLGDYWGVENIHPEMFDNKGTSIIMINSLKGKQLLSGIEGLRMIDTSLESCCKGNPCIYSSVEPNKHRKLYMKYINKSNFSLMTNFLCNRMSVKRKVKSLIYKIVK